MVSYDLAKKRLDEHGELQIRFDSDEVWELHQGDTEWDDTDHTIAVTDGSDIVHLDGDKIESIEEHPSHRVTDE